MQKYLYLALILVLSACQQVSFQKRLHLKGYYFSHAPRLKANNREAALSFEVKDTLRPNKKQQTESVSTIRNADANSILIAKTANTSVNTSTNTVENKQAKDHVNSEKQKSSPVVLKQVNSNKKQHVIKKDVRKVKRSKNEFLGWYMALGLGLLGVNYKRRNHKSRLAAWGNKNRKKSITLILLGLGANYVTNIYLGKQLAEMGFTSSDLTRDVLLGLLGLSILAFPSNRLVVNNFKNRSSAFVVTYLLLSALNINTGIRMHTRPVQELSFTEQQVANYLEPNSDTTTYNPYGKGLAWRIPLTIFFIICNVALSFFLAALICSLICSGLGVIAVLVGVLGYGGIIVGMIYTLKAIWRKPNTKKPNNPSGEDLDEKYDPLMSY